MKSPLYLWANALLAEFVEGCADAFLIVSGGAAVAQSGSINLPQITGLQLLYSVLLGGLWYVASYLKKTPTPASLPQPKEVNIEAQAPTRGFWAGGFVSTPRPEPLAPTTKTSDSVDK